MTKIEVIPYQDSWPLEYQAHVELFFPTMHEQFVDGHVIAQGRAETHRRKPVGWQSITRAIKLGWDSTRNCHGPKRGVDDEHRC